MTRTEGGRSKAARRIGLLALPFLVAATFAACGDDSDDGGGFLGGDQPTGDAEAGGDAPTTDGGDAPADGGGDDTTAAPGGGGDVPSGIPELDGLVQECGGGDMQSCDDIFRDAEDHQTDPNVMDYAIYGDTCGGLQPTGTGVWCVDAFG